MTQQATLRALDAGIASTFSAEGLMDEGTYTPPGGPAVPVDVFVDLGVGIIGELGQVIGTQDEIVLFRSQVSAPVRAATVQVGATTYRLDAKQSGDESSERWVVRTYV